MNIGKGSLQTRLPSNKYRVGYDMIKWNSDNGHTPASGVMGDTMSGSSCDIEKMRVAIMDGTMTVTEAVAWADDVIDREDSAEWYGAGEYLTSRYEDLMDRA